MLRVLALAPPQFPHGGVGDRALSSGDPASLFNACRSAARAAERGGGAWGHSNWAAPRKERRDSVLMLHALREGLPELQRRLLALRPNLLLIGSMSVCLPGAIACARFAKALLGDEVCVVLGGRHANEAMYRGPGGEVAHHPSSPLRLVHEGRLEPVFDVVISGDGEDVVVALGELIERVVRAGRPAAEARRALHELPRAARGQWIAGAIVDGAIRTALGGEAGPLVRAELPVPAEMFGVAARFDVFDHRPTAHVFSDVGRGCIYDCTFCSERRTLTGAPQELDSSADRLFHQLERVVAVVAEDHDGSGAAAFCEDSTLLAYSPPLIERLVERLARAPWRIRFGGQLTIDQILTRPQHLAPLRQAGMEYLFLGLETMAPDEIGGMSKDVGRRRGRWVDRAEAALELLAGAGISCGVAVLFGLGEPHQRRLELIEQVGAWRRRYGFPSPISMNWAVQHPLAGHDGGTGYRYTEWSIPAGPFLGFLRDFGEASLVYPIAGQPLPKIDEMREVHTAICALYDEAGAETGGEAGAPAGAGARLEQSSTGA